MAVTFPWYRSHKYRVSLSEGALHYLMKYLKVRSSISGKIRSFRFRSGTDLLSLLTLFFCLNRDGTLGWWLGGVVVRALDSQSTGRGFDSQPLHCWATTLGKLFTPVCLCSPSNLVPCEGFHVNAPVCGNHSWVQ